MTRLESIESLIPKIPCPVCLNSRFEVNLSCAPHTECDVHAHCQHCHYKFVVTEDPKTMEQVWNRLHKHFEDSGCPQCGDNKLHLEFLCDVGSEDCFSLVRCGDNEHYSRFDHSGFKYLFT